MTTDNLHDRVAELEQRVAELEETLEKRQSGTQSGLVDRYDEYVLDAVEDVQDTHPRALMARYEEAGVVSEKKQKRRAKRLTNLVVEDKI